MPFPHSRHSSRINQFDPTTTNVTKTPIFVKRHFSTFEKMAFIPHLPSFRRPARRSNLTMTQATQPAFAPGVLTLENEGAYAVMAAAKALEQRTGRDVVHLEIGQPGFDTPSHISDAGIEAIQAGKTKYSHPRGVPNLRAAIADWARRHRALECSAENVVVGPGAKPGLFFATLALIRDSRDEVIIPDPGFPTYSAMVSVAGGTAVPVKLRNDMTSFDMEAFRASVNHNTKIVVVNSPGNPTGGVIPLEDLIEIAALSRKYDFWVISDEIYSQLCYEDTYTSIASLPGMSERTVVVDGFSKSYCMTGWRLGWAIMPKELAERVELLIVHSVGCTATFAQEAGVAALTGPDGVTELREVYRRRRDIVVNGLNAIEGVRCEKPEGAFYAFADVREYGKSSDVAKFLLEESFVATLAGTDFGEGGEGFIRLSYVSEEKDLREGLRRIEEGLKKMRSNSTV